MNLKANYFDSNESDGQTPSNTPNNKSKGGMSYDLNTVNFDKVQGGNDQAQDNELKESNNLAFCANIILGKQCNSQEKCCTKIYCNKCSTKVTIIIGSKLADSSIQSNKILNECLENNDAYNTYSCICSKISVSDEPKNAKDLGFDWECDGHHIH
jgi:hypothetical protein